VKIGYQRPGLLLENGRSNYTVCSWEIIIRNIVPWWWGRSQW